MKYGIVFFPSKEVQEFANNYRKRYDPHYSLVQPHITIKGAFEADNATINKIIAYMEQATSNLSPFVIEYNRFSSFHPTNNVIYIAIKDSEYLHTLYERMHSDILAHDEPYSFIPHITVGQKMSNEELHDVLSNLKMKRFKYQDKVDRIQLIYQDQDQIWKEHQTFLLEG
jgi:2'-5' RNA ligase